MEQKQKVWIRGNKTRNEEVIAKLVELGGIDTHFITGSDPNRIYFIDEKNRIDSIKDSSRVAKIMTEEYQEIKLDDSPLEDATQDYSLKFSKDLSTFAKTCINIPEGTSVNIRKEDVKFMIIVEPKEVKKEETQFKKGDIVFLNVQGDNKIYQHLAIVKSIDKDKGVYFSVSFCINEDELSAIHESMWFSKENIKSIRYATDEEKQELFNKLAKQKQLRWDEKKLKFEGIRWRAEKGENFWYISGYGRAICWSDNRDKYSNYFYNSHNYFQTEELANKALPKWKEFFKSLSL